jgi:hypothetical protein
MFLLVAPMRGAAERRPVTAGYSVFRLKADSLP